MSQPLKWTGVHPGVQFDNSREMRLETPIRSVPMLTWIIPKRSFRTLNNSNCFSCSNPMSAESMSSLKYGLMLRTSWPLSPCKEECLHYFDISCRHRLHKYHHITFIHIQERLSILLREYATGNLVSVEKKKVFLRSHIALAIIRFQWEKMGVRWDGRMWSLRELGKWETVVKYPQPRVPGNDWETPLRSQPMGGGRWCCEQDRSVPGMELSPHLSSVSSSLATTARNTVPGELALFPLLLTFFLTLPF